MNFGEMIRKAREREGLSQEQLGHLLGVDRITVGRWERNQFTPRYETVVSIANELDADAATLLRLAGYKVVNV